MKRMIAAAAALSLLFSVNAWAVSPEFARTPEEWAHLQDNVLEYYEIDDLVKEYNPKVINNDADLNKFRRDYGMSNSDVTAAYEDLAAALLDSITDPDPDLPTYAMQASANVMNEQMANNLLSQADSSTEDYEIYRLNYEMARATIAKNARSAMITYYNDILAAEQARLNLQMLGTALNVTNTRASVGMATQIDVLNATEQYMTAQQAVTRADSDLAAVKKKLQVACGWKYESEAEIGPIPEPDPARVDAADLTGDIQKALANNYTLRANERRLENARSDTQRDTLGTTIQGNRQNISIAVTNAYYTMKSSRDAWTAAASNTALQTRSLEMMTAQYQQGTVSRVELENQQIQTRLAQIAQEQAKNALLEAIMSYDYIVAGLAGA